MCHINSGGTPSRGVAEYYGGKIPWAKIGDIEKSNGVIYSTEEYITEAGLEKIGKEFSLKILCFLQCMVLLVSCLLWYWISPRMQSLVFV